MKIKSKYAIWAIVIVIVLAVGYFFYPKLNNNDDKNVSANKDGKTYYFSFNGDYSFLVPKDYGINDGVISNGQLITKQGQAVKTNTIEEIYAGGGIVVQMSTPFNKDKQSFQNYINNILKGEMDKSLNGTTEVQFGTKDNIDTARVKTTSSGKLVRVQYLYNNDPSILVVSADENEAFETIVSSLVASSNRIDDYTSLRSVTNSASYLLKYKMADDIYRLAAKSFTEKISLSDLKSSFEKASKVLELSASINGGSLKDGEFTVAIILAQVTEKSPKKTMAYIVFQKEDNVWKISGVTIPTDKEFFGPNS